MSAAAGNQIFEEVGWAGTAFQYRHSFSPPKEKGVALPSLVSLYKKQQSSRMVQLFTSDDLGVRRAAHLLGVHRAAHLLLQEEERAQQTRFNPAVFVNEIRAVDPSKSRQALADCQIPAGRGGCSAET